ncbi:MAG: rhodanese-like domain-containing protein [Chloroflexi bacterium]|nr:rhodanese-like domain-containing protein [Chloroflexota bacterium]
MSKKIHLIVIIVLLALLSACAPQTPQIPQTEDAVPRVTVEEAKSTFEDGKAIIVDVRSAESYAAGHAAGAISIPLAEFENNIDSLPLDKDQWIITYCT